MDETYIEDPKDLRDINFNIKTLIQKFNHEHTSMVRNVEDIGKKVVIIDEDVGTLKKSFSDFNSYLKGMNLMLKGIIGFIGLIATLIGIGALFG